MAHEPRLGVTLSRLWTLEASGLWSVGDELNPDLRLQNLVLTQNGARHRLALGREPIRWGAGLTGSLLLGRSAPPLWQVSWHTQKALRAPVLKRTTWSGGAFLAYLDDEDRRIPRPLLLGHRLSWQPTAWFEMTGTRTILFGGKGRTRRLNLRRIWEILTVQNENIVGARPPSDSDQRASFEARLKVRQSQFFYEYAGEDVNDPPLPSAVAHHYGWMGEWRGYTAIVEFVETITGRNRWYSHTLYRTGYFHKGYPLGHGLGGDAEALTLGVWSRPGDASWRVLRREEEFGHLSDNHELRVTWEVGTRIRFGDIWAEASLVRTRRIGPGRELRAPGYARDRVELRFERSRSSRTQVPR